MASSQTQDSIRGFGEYKDSQIMRGYQTATDMVPFSLLVAGVTWQLLGPMSAIATVWAPMGYNLVYLGPLSVLSYLQLLSQDGILLKDGRVLESLREVDTIVFDKTGTLTVEQPTISQIHALGGFEEHEVLRYATAAEQRQRHPIARALREYAEGLGLDIPPCSDHEAVLGHGIHGVVEGASVHVGSERFMHSEGIALRGFPAGIIDRANDRGISLVYVAIDGQLRGLLEFTPSLRPEVAGVIRELQRRGKRICVLSGDREEATRYVADQLGADDYFAGVLPEGKVEVIERLREQGRFVCFVGDGLNDLGALKTAQVSVSLRGAATAATDTAQTVIMNDDLSSLITLFDTSADYERNMRSNTLLTFGSGIACIGGVYLLGFSVPVSMGFKYTSLGLGFINSMTPLWARRD